MTDWTEAVRDAFRMLGYDEQDSDERAMQAFVARWGRLDTETFVRVLKEGQEEERVVAIFVIGSLGTPWARELLLPFLHSGQPKERWASALCLGQMKEDRALPVLLDMLTEALLPQQHYNSEGVKERFYDDWRPLIARLLGEWERPDLAPALLRALKDLWQQEQQWKGPFFQKRVWRDCQDELVYALGQLGSFESLAEIAAPESKLSRWKVCLALGYLHARKEEPEILLWGMLPKSPLQQRVAAVLEQRFGLSAKEQEHCLALFKGIDF